jgi:hypothetical protein
MAAAVTRSLLGWGVVVGPFYVVLGVTLALTRSGFDLSRHQLSLLMLGEHGWTQTTNLILSGLMTAAAAVGVYRALHGTPAARWAGVLLGLFAVCLLGSGIFPPDPMDGFPPSSTTGDGSVSGILHLMFGAIGFLALGAAAIVVAGRSSRWGRRTATYSRTSGVIVIAGFVGGAAFATSPIGVAFLWIAVLAAWAWLLVISIRLYRTVPHPDADRRSALAG